MLNTFGQNEYWFVGFKNSCGSRGFLFVFYSTPPHERYAISAKTRYKHGLDVLF